MYKERQNLLDIKKEINASRKTYIEILGIFSGIITFLFGSIQLFGRADISYTQSLTNILALGLVLCIFIALITITISLEKKIPIMDCMHCCSSYCFPSEPYVFIQ